MYVYASKLRKFSHFYILKLLFLSIFCWYIRYSVGTKEWWLSAYKHVPTVFHMYRQNSEKALWGAIAPPPPLATLVLYYLTINCCSYVNILLRWIFLLLLLFCFVYRRWSLSWRGSFIKTRCFQEGGLFHDELQKWHISVVFDKQR